MAIIQGPVAKGQQSVAYPGSSGDVIYNRFTMPVALATPIGSILEIGSIPPNCRVIDAVLENDALGASVTCSVGVMSGAPGATFNADGTTPRTCDTVLFAAATQLTAAAALRMSQASGFKIAPTAVERSIGITTAGATTTPAGTITLGVWLANT
jgi:hypothetical protein